MTVQELEDIFSLAVVILKDNKQLATPVTLAGIENIVQQLGGPAPQVDFSTTFQEVLKDVSMVVDIEKRLVETTVSDTLVRVLSNLPNHPIIMHLIAKIL